MEYTSKFKGSEIDSILESVGNPADSPSSDGSAFGRINQLAVDLEKAGSSDEVMRKIYTSYGAVYNAGDNTYTFNELKLTPDEMLKIYLFENCANVRGVWECYCRYGKYNAGRTNFCADKVCSSTDVSFIEMEFNYLCYSNITETFKIPFGFVPKSINGVINGNSKLTKVLGELDMRNIKQDNWNCLKNNAILEVIKLKSLKCSYSLAGNPKINYDSWKYLVDNAANTSAITVTIDPIPFALLTGTASDDDYTPTGHAKDEWMAIVTAAQGKQISFAEAV